MKDKVRDMVLNLITRAMNEIDPYYGTDGVGDWLDENPDWYELCDVLNLNESKDCVEQYKYRKGDHVMTTSSWINNMGVTIPRGSVVTVCEDVRSVGRSTRLIECRWGIHVMRIMGVYLSDKIEES